MAVRTTEEAFTDMEPGQDRSTPDDPGGLRWSDGRFPVLAGLLAGLCCGAPPLLGTLGLTGLAAALSAMPFGMHLVLQWVALGLILVAWGWIGLRWRRTPSSSRWRARSVVIGAILIAATLYVLKNWYVHVFVMR